MYHPDPDPRKALMTAHPLMFVREDDLRCPHFRCPRGGEPITERANVLFDRQYSGHLAAYHKECHPREIAPGAETDPFLLERGWSSGVTPEALRGLADHIEAS